MGTESRLYKGDRNERKVSKAEPAPRVHPDPEGPPLVEIISIGTELCRGRMTDTNAPYLAESLTRRGARVVRISTVPDEDKAITAAIHRGLEAGCSLVVTTGGLGPTSDDRTLRATADALGVPLSIHTEAKEMVEAAYRRLKERRIVSNDGLNRAREKQCALPAGGVPLANVNGTAPGVRTSLAGGATVVNLPGHPDEMRTTWENAVPGLRMLEERPATAVRELEAPTLDESELRPWLDKVQSEFPEIWIQTYAPGYRHKSRRIKITLQADAATKHQAELMVEGALRRLLALAGAG
jgi:molybdenum cofactor synthesis domain-containing protein